VSPYGLRILERYARQAGSIPTGDHDARSAVVTKLRGLADQPDEMVVEFGIKLGAKAGVVIASADTEANFTVSLTWRRPEVGAVQEPRCRRSSSLSTSCQRLIWAGSRFTARGERRPSRARSGRPVALRNSA
jgi:hypothetical protein